MQDADLLVRCRPLDFDHPRYIMTELTAEGRSKKRSWLQGKDNLAGKPTTTVNFRAKSSNS